MDNTTPDQGLSRRRMLLGTAAGTAAVWVAPAVTTLGSAAFAAGSPATGGTRTAHYTLDLSDYPGQYGHAGTVTVAPDGSFTGAGTHDNGGGTETVTGSFVGGQLTYDAVYDNGYRYSVPSTTVTAGSFSTTITADNGSFRATGTFTFV